MSPSFSFDAYSLKSVSFSRTDKADQNDEIFMNMEVSVSRNTDKTDKFRSMLNFKANGAIQAEVTVFGLFTGSDINEDGWETEFQVISASILLPFIRSILAGLSAQDGSQPFLIPTINLNEAFRANEEKQQ